MAPTVLRIDPSEPYSSYISKLREAARALSRGAVAVFPTDTVYALGADIAKSDALSRIAAIKGRDSGKPFASLIHSAVTVTRYAAEFPPAARRAAAAYWPGPLTLVLPAKSGGTIGLRVPANRIASDLPREVGRPISATSANRSGCEPLSDFDALYREFGDEADIYIHGDWPSSSQASSIVRAAGRRLEVLREGVIPPEKIRSFEGLKVMFVCTGNSCRSPIAESLARKRAAEKLGTPQHMLKSAGMTFVSAGTAALGIGGAHPHAEQVVAELGASLTGHRTRALIPSEVEQSDWVYVMTRAHRELVRSWVPEAKSRVRLLDPSADIQDPIGEPIEVYRECARRIERAMAPIVDALLEELKESR